MLGPLLRSSHLGWIAKTAAAIELTMPATTTLAAAYLLLVAGATLRLPHISTTNEHFLFYFVAFCLTMASLGLGFHALSPFLLGLLPWRFASSLFYLPYFAIWKTVVALKGHPKSWLRTTRERAELDNSAGPHAVSVRTFHIDHDPCRVETHDFPQYASERAE